jgi:ParB family transcriptional regulator, chromosome partitioning protein
MARTGLGRGLDALIPTAATRAPAAPSTTDIPLAEIRPNPEQPRRSFGQEELESLAASIREHGVLQPIVVQRREGQYTLIAGERRVQAARLAGLLRVPAIVRSDPAHSSLELALVENLHRTDLNAIEQARAYRLLQEQYGFSQEAIAQRLGRSKPAISNTLRLLGAPSALQEALLAGQIAEGHLRALLSLDEQTAQAALGQVLANRLSVRQTEALARRLERPHRRHRTVDPDVARAQDELRRRLGTKVRVAMGRRGGRIIVDFYSAEEFERLYELLLGAGR